MDHLHRGIFAFMGLISLKVIVCIVRVIVCLVVILVYCRIVTSALTMASTSSTVLFFPSLKRLAGRQAARWLFPHPQHLPWWPRPDSPGFRHLHSLQALHAWRPPFPQSFCHRILICRYKKLCHKTPQALAGLGVAHFVSGKLGSKGLIVR